MQFIFYATLIEAGHMFDIGVGCPLHPVSPDHPSPPRKRGHSWQHPCGRKWEYQLVDLWGPITLLLL